MNETEDKCKMFASDVVTYEVQWWVTECGYELELGHWASPTNTDELFKFCPFCGKPTEMIDKEETK